MKFTFHSATRRVDWLYQQYAGASVTSAPDFVDAVNRSYYAHAAESYGERYVDDIAFEFRTMCEAEVFPRSERRAVINVGGGAGFEYNQLRDNGVTWSKYIFIEPDPRMAKQFCVANGDTDGSLTVLGGTLREHSELIGSIGNKLIVICSCLHHIVWVEEFLDTIKSVMHAGDFLMLAHEPNNRYYGTPQMVVNAMLRGFTSDVVLRRLGFKGSSGSRKSARLWGQVNQELVASGVASREMPPIAIRRLIDYWVGTKGDWKLLGVPPGYNEGFWSSSDIEAYLGRDFETRFFRTYRRLGDPAGKNWVARADRFLGRYSADGGSVFNLLIQRCR